MEKSPFSTIFPLVVLKSDVMMHLSRAMQLLGINMFSSDRIGSIKKPDNATPSVIVTD